jgi:hypothetical protein
MLMNSSCTVYREKTFERVFIPACFWKDSRGKALAKGGMSEDAAVTVYIPETYAELSPKPRDIIVRGKCAVEVDTTSEKAVSDGVKALRASDPVTVRTVEDKLYGRFCRHVKVVAL